MGIENNPADLDTSLVSSETEAGAVEGMSQEAETAVRALVSSRGDRQAIEQIKQLDPKSQADAAESYFMQMTGDREMPMAGSNTEQYTVYMALKGSEFSHKFRELEADRLNKFGYSLPADF